MKGLTHEQTKLLKEQIVSYRTDGHHADETAEKFGVSLTYVYNACAGVGGLSVNHKSNSETLRKRYEETKEEYARKIVEERTPWLEYVGGYERNDGHITVRCKTCGCVINMSSQSVRKRRARCTKCYRKELREKRETYREEKQAKKEWQKHIREANRKAEQLSFSFCSVCGQPFFAQQKTYKYCSAECSHKAQNAQKEAKRRLKIQGGMVDNDITLSGLFKRDNGFCYICGGKCDYADYVETDKAIVCGDMYPSIDHVMPLALGGKHAWNNVKLAHRRCNSLKRDIPL